MECQKFQSYTRVPPHHMAVGPPSSRLGCRTGRDCPVLGDMPRRTCPPARAKASRADVRRRGTLIPDLTLQGPIPYRKYPRTSCTRALSIPFLLWEKSKKVSSTVLMDAWELREVPIWSSEVRAPRREELFTTLPEPRCFPVPCPRPPWCSRRLVLRRQLRVLPLHRTDEVPWASEHRGICSSPRQSAH